MPVVGSREMRPTSLAPNWLAPIANGAPAVTNRSLPSNAVKRTEMIASGFEPFDVPP